MAAMTIGAGARPASEAANSNSTTGAAVASLPSYHAKPHSCGKYGTGCRHPSTTLHTSLPYCSGLHGFPGCNAMYSQPDTCSTLKRRTVLVVAANCWWVSAIFMLASAWAKSSSGAAAEAAEADGPVVAAAVAHC